MYIPSEMRYASDHERMAVTWSESKKKASYAVLLSIDGIPVTEASGTAFLRPGNHEFTSSVLDLLNVPLGECIPHPRTVKFTFRGEAGHVYTWREIFGEMQHSVTTGPPARLAE
jgi:hypothetical protein